MKIFAYNAERGAGTKRQLDKMSTQPKVDKMSTGQNVNSTKSGQNVNSAKSGQNVNSAKTGQNVNSKQRILKKNNKFLNIFPFDILAYSIEKILINVKNN